MKTKSCIIDVKILRQVAVALGMDPDKVLEALEQREDWESLPRAGALLCEDEPVVADIFYISTRTRVSDMEQYIMALDDVLGEMDDPNQYELLMIHYRRKVAMIKWNWMTK